MHPRRELALFIAESVLLSLVLGWFFWNSTVAEVGVSMLAVPVISAMLASQGFGWRRKLTYTAATVGLYILGSQLARVTGLVELASKQILHPSSFPSLSVALYAAYLSTFPFAMLLLFVGRNPSLLWRKNKD
jgi:pheromone shutdown protein TraB